MDNLRKSIRFVKLQQSRVQDIISRHPDDENTKRTLLSVLNQFQKTIDSMSAAESQIADLSEQSLYINNENKILREQIERLEKQLKLKSESIDSLSLKPEDVKGLPQELIKELSVNNEADQQEFLIQELFEQAGGSMTLDQVLIAFFRKTGDIISRTKMNQRLYRMCQKNLLSPIPDKKGAYSIYDFGDVDSGQNEAEQIELLGIVAGDP